MSRRALVVFWGAVAAAVFLLGGGVSSVRSVLAGGGPEAVVLLVLSALGLAVALFVAGRVVFVAARLQRRAVDVEIRGLIRIEQDLHHMFTGGP